jgi:hypothetical protein
MNLYQAGVDDSGALLLGSQRIVLGPPARPGGRSRASGDSPAGRRT